MEIEQLETNQEQSRYGTYLKAMDECPLCSTELEIQYRVDKQEDQVVEEAHCPSCKVKSVSKTHSLQ